MKFLGTLGLTPPRPTAAFAGVGVVRG